MIDYTQPSFFKFGHDSIDLIEHIKSLIITSDSILDLGAGSGILGIELANFLRPKKLTLLELQKDYSPYLRENLSTQLKVHCEAKVVISSFGEWVPDRQYEMIVCNPPYYLPGRGQKSQDDRRDTARSFHVDGWNVLLNLISNSLLPSGRSFFVIKNDKIILDHLKKKLPVGLGITEIFRRDIVFLELMRLDKD